MPSPLSPKEAVKQAREEAKEPNVLTFFDFFNFEGDSICDDVAEAFVLDGLLSEDGQPLTKFTQLFQQPQIKKAFENKLRQLIIISALKRLVAAKLEPQNLSILEDQPLIVRGFCEIIADQITQLFTKDPLPENDFLPQLYADKLARETLQIIGNSNPSRIDDYNFLNFLLARIYQDKKTVKKTTEQLLNEIETALKSITEVEVLGTLSFYAEMSLVKSKLVIDLNFYNLTSDNPRVQNIERYQLETITLNDKLNIYDQQTKEFETILQTTIDLDEQS